MVRLKYSTIPLTSQVGGHSGVQTSEDGSLIFKPAVPLELQFYQSALANPVLAPLLPFIPKFYGTLKLEGQIDTERTAAAADIAVTHVHHETLGPKDFLVLENLTHPFVKPNILDIKLGTILYDEAASPEKIARMIETARQTTSLETGIRLTGFQVYDNISGQAVITPKSYGKTIKPSDLPEGFAKFFPLASRTELGDTTSEHGLPHHFLLPILKGIREDIIAKRSAFEQIHLRMPGESILIAYEADWRRAEEALKAQEARKQGVVDQRSGDVGVTEFDQEQEVDGLEGDEDDEEVEDDEGDDDDDEDSDDESTCQPGPAYVVKLIDFAHTRLKPGEGPDEGALVGLNTILKLLDGRIAQVEAIIA